MFHEFDYMECYDRSAVALIEELHHVEAAGNARDIARMEMYVRCDQRRLYRRDDCFDTAHWLSIETGISAWKARRWLTAGYALDRLPILRAAYERGELSTDKFVELARFATPATEAQLLPWAQRTSPAGIRARADRELRAADDAIAEEDKNRSLQWEWAEDRTALSLWGSLPADQGARFVKAVERMAAKLPSSPEDEPANAEARRADALVALASASIANDQSSDRATLVVHADVDTILNQDRNGVLAGGLPLPPNAASLVSCDARVQTVLYGDDGAMFHISSPSYVVPKWVRRQVEHRDDYRCTFPNCGRKAFTDIHHIVPWPKGRSEPSNLVLLCHTHHRLVHIHGWHVQLAKNGTARWFRPDWTPYSSGPAPRSIKRSDTLLESFDNHQLVGEGSG